ncbi:aldo/keto reductase [Carbonactinospora thermoautotrophica]|uniref:aldo/keto reductase n=1 Tax=Carbonactinospora thermoautotrophica TaxID=1469144 RepID=UPI00226E3819|nr:aldo/keto reductase [Carbonactinospora thermoautotrophica]
MRPDPGSALVLGTWGISGAFTTPAGPGGYSHVPEERFRQVLDAAHEAGIRWIDVAPGYGAGEGLRRLAAWQRSRGRAFCVVVKPGRPLTADGPRSDLSLDGLRAELERCAELVGQPAGILLKDPPAEAFEHGELAGVLEALRVEHPDARVGVATHRLDLVPLLPRLPGTERPVVQLEYHLLNRASSVPAVRAATALGWEAWAMQPLAYGFLGGRHTAATTFPPDDWRSRMPEPVRAALVTGARYLPRVLPPALRERPLAEVALAWCLADPCVSRVVVGPRSREQLGAALAAVRLASDAEFRRFAADQRALLGA